MNLMIQAVGKMEAWGRRANNSAEWDWGDTDPQKGAATCPVAVNLRGRKVPRGWR